MDRLADMFDPPSRIGHWNRNHENRNHEKHMRLPTVVYTRFWKFRADAPYRVSDFPDSSTRRLMSHDTAPLMIRSLPCSTSNAPNSLSMDEM